MSRLPVSPSSRFDFRVVVDSEAELEPPTPPAVLEGSAPFGRQLALDGVDVYWTDDGDLGSSTQVFHARLDDGAATGDRVWSTPIEQESYLDLSSPWPPLALSGPYVYVVLLSPSYARRSVPNEMTLVCYSRDLEHENWRRTICSDSDCSFDSLIADEVGNVYISWTEAAKQRLLRVYGPDGTVRSDDIPVDYPGFPIAEDRQLHIPGRVWNVTAPDYQLGLDFGPTSRRRSSPLSAAPLALPPEEWIDRTPRPLHPSNIQKGGQLEVLEKLATGELVRLAYVRDLVEGLEFTFSLSNLDTCAFRISVDRFVVSPDTTKVGFLRDLQRSWQTVHSSTSKVPYDKSSMVRDHVYVRYTEPSGRQFPYRVSVIEAEELGHLAGVGVSQAIELSDYLTQYYAGRSQFTGKLPSEIATRILDGDQSIRISNRRFVTDRGASMTLLSELPDMTPVLINNKLSQPLPLMMELEAANVDDVSMFSGLPHESVGPNGSARDLSTGYFGYISYSDPNPSVNGVFANPLVMKNIAAPLSFTSGSAGLEQGEGPDHMSRVYYGCIKAPTTGQFSFRIVGGSPFRVFFRGRMVFEYVQLPEIGGTATWTSELTANRWYPFVIHYINVTTARTIQFFWTPPSSAEALVPATNMSHELFKGLALIRFVDSSGVTRYMQAFKRWDGKALVLAIPCDSRFPAYMTYNSDWPKSMPPGTLIEELQFPGDQPFAGVYDWGSGWTRRPGPSYLDLPSVSTSRFQRRVRDY